MRMLKPELERQEQHLTSYIKSGKQKIITLETELQIFNSNAKSILLYASETWKITNNITDKIQVFLNRCLRCLLGNGT